MISGTHVKVASPRVYARSLRFGCSERFGRCGLITKNSRRSCQTGRALALLLPVLLLGACEQIRLLTYPADFVWLDERGVHDIMYRMADSMIRLDELIGQDGESAQLDADERERQRTAVDEELSALDEIATALAAGVSTEADGKSLPRTNHLLIDEHIDDFIDDVARARRFVAEQPPNYYAAGRLGGSCTGCHRWRGDAA